MRPAESRSASTSAPFENTDLPFTPANRTNPHLTGAVGAMGSAPRTPGILGWSRPAHEGRYAAEPATPLPDARIARHRRARGEAVAVRLRRGAGVVGGGGARVRRAGAVEHPRRPAPLDGLRPRPRRI